jgi:hypothetical protein
MFSENRLGMEKDKWEKGRVKESQQRQQRRR